VHFCAALQVALLRVDWPEDVLGWRDCREAFDDAGVLIWRGLRARCGMAWGKPDYRKPLNTGEKKYCLCFDANFASGFLNCKHEERCVDFWFLWFKKPDEQFARNWFSYHCTLA
jgi:hypothetical protein